ncbi:HesA/MoeB/ThiF family protein [uncultured Methanobrevibacter sp.]|uniref:HesA/MoeB/ThiF family protein n=1 Tax=uncultured Methanobrevibacter sp. TaxID=253161 RepID=UPI0025D48B29|nr:HesA/MoeB/ThiF family protein [uncultured Methanobrevibacter sp.]
MQSNEDNYWQIATRQMGIVTRHEQEKFKNAKITVIGCGGIGGETIEMLARMGIGELVLVDEDSFDITNFNRQNFANSSTLNQDKSRVACENVRLINPNIKVTSFNEHVDCENIDEIIGDSNMVIDALDNILARIVVSRKAREKKIPFIHGAIHGTLGQISVFLANTPSYEELFNLPSCEKPLTEEVIGEIESMTSGVPPAIGPTPNLIGCLQAMEAYKIITGIGKVTVAPKMLTFDLLDFASFSINEI